MKHLSSIFSVCGFDLYLWAGNTGKWAGNTGKWAVVSIMSSSFIGRWEMSTEVKHKLVNVKFTFFLNL